MLARPGIRLCVFSTGSRASSAMLQEVMMLLGRIEGGTQRIVKRNEEQLFLAPTTVDVSAGSAKALALTDAAGVSKMYSK